MTQDPTNEQPPVTLSESAADILKSVAENADVESGEAVVRFSVQQHENEISHHIALEEAPAESDVVFEQHGLTVVVDQEQVPFLNGSHIDYQASGDQPQLLVSNPNIAAS